MDSQRLEVVRKKMRHDLIDGLNKAIDEARIDLGEGLSQSDVLGCIEWVKQKYIFDCFREE